MQIKFEGHKDQRDFLTVDYNEEWGVIISVEPPDGTEADESPFFISHVLYGDRIEKLYDFLGEVLKKRKKKKEKERFSLKIPFNYDTIECDLYLGGHNEY